VRPVPAFADSGPHPGKHARETFRYPVHKFPERRKNSLEFPSISLPSAGRRGSPRVSAASRGKTFWIHDAHSFDAQTAAQDSRIVEISAKNHCPSHQPRPKQALPAAHLKLQSAGPPPTRIKNVEATLMQVSRWNGSRQYFFRKWALFDVQKKGFLSAGPFRNRPPRKTFPSPKIVFATNGSTTRHDCKSRSDRPTRSGPVRQDSSSTGF
jgi:hypothetical protein